MKISIRKGTGIGPTEISAFDQALVRANVANFNLIYLSSVLPPDSEVVNGGDTSPVPGEWGDRLYLVMAQKRTIQRNQEVWAGIGWMQDPKTKKGLLVEHEGHSEDEVRADINHSLKALAENRNMKFGPANMVVTGIKCEELPVCALVVAVFEPESWQGNSPNMNLLRKLVRSKKKS